MPYTGKKNASRPQILTPVLKLEITFSTFYIGASKALRLIMRVMQMRSLFSRREEIFIDIIFSYT